MKTKMVFVALLFAAVACKKEDSLDLNPTATNPTASGTGGPMAMGGEEYSAEYREILDFIEEFEAWHSEMSIGTQLSVSDGIYFLEAALNARNGNFEEFFDVTEEEVQQFQIDVNGGMLDFADMMNEMESMETFINADLGSNEIHYIDLEEAGLTGSAITLRVMKYKGEPREVLDLWTEPELLPYNADSKRAWNFATCYPHNDAASSARHEVAGRINYVLGAQRIVLNMMPVNVQDAGFLINYNTSCGCITCSVHEWGACDELWMGDDLSECVNKTRVNNYITAAWDYLQNNPLSGSFEYYNFRVDKDGYPGRSNLPDYNWVYTAKKVKWIPIYALDPQ